jgi:hypothetical protein
MMKVIVLALLELALWCICSGAFGQQADTYEGTHRAGYVAGLCEREASTVGHLENSTSEDGLCLGMVEGWRDMTDILSVLSSDGRYQLHVEQTATTAQLVRVFYHYVRVHPEVENKNSILVFLQSLNDGKLLTFTPVKGSK